jgi:hypothetical protein
MERAFDDKPPMYHDVPIVRCLRLSDAAFSDEGGINAAYARRRTELAGSGRTCAATSTTGVATKKTFRAGVAVARSGARSFSGAGAN